MLESENNPERLFSILEAQPLNAEGELALDGLRQILELKDRANHDLEKQLAYERQTSSTDHLTQLPNLRAFDQALSNWEQELNPLPFERRADEYSDREGLLLLVDLDNFKLVNDVLGYYSAGNNVLRIIAELLQITIRNNDELYRIGGDEFAILASVDSGKQQIVYQTIVNRFEANLSALRARESLKLRPLDPIELEAIEVIGASFAYGALRKGGSFDEIQQTVHTTMNMMKLVKEEKGHSMR